MRREGGCGERLDLEKSSVWGVFDITVLSYLKTEATGALLAFGTSFEQKSL